MASEAGSLTRQSPPRNPRSIRGAKATRNRRFFGYQRPHAASLRIRIWLQPYRSAREPTRLQPPTFRGAETTCNTIFRPLLASQKFVLLFAQRHYAQPSLPHQRRIGEQLVGLYFGQRNRLAQPLPRLDFH